MTEPAASVLRSAWRDPVVISAPFSSGSPGSSLPLSLRSWIDGRVDHAALREGAPRQSDAVPRSSEKLRLNAGCNVTVARGLAWKCERQGVQGEECGSGALARDGASHRRRARSSQSACSVAVQ